MKKNELVTRQNLQDLKLRNILDFSTMLQFTNSNINIMELNFGKRKKDDVFSNSHIIIFLNSGI